MVEFGYTEPRIWTPPLRELTEETSRGFEVIRFAEDVLSLKLLPWQEWLLIHLLELNPDGTLRFRKSLVIVGRQNGKTLIAAVLLAFWLYVDAGRWPELQREDQFEIVNASYKLDNAMDPWRQVRAWGAPDDPKVGISADRVPMLQAFTNHPRMVNGEIELSTKGGAKLMPRTFEGARGKRTTRMFLDELRKQQDFEGWAAIEKAGNAQYDSLLLAVSNAGTAKSQVLLKVRKSAHAGVENPDTEWFVAEWSAEPKARLDDPVAFAQANPSAGYLPGMTIQRLMRAAAEAPDETTERIEVLGQWQTAEVQPMLSVAAWEQSRDAESVIMDGSQMTMAVDVDFDRQFSAVAVAGWRSDGLPHVEAIARRAGLAWTIKFMQQVREAQGITRVAVRTRGAPSSELAGPLKDAGFDVVEIVGAMDGQASGQFKDSVFGRQVRHRGQGPLDAAVAGTQGAVIGGVQVLDRKGAAVSSSPLFACVYALFALRNDFEESAVSAYEPQESDEQASGEPWWRR